MLFAPTSFVITTDTPPEVSGLVERDEQGRMTKINLPDRLVIVANHQAYLDWMYVWILACYSGNASGLVILLKASLKKVPVVGWGMVSETCCSAEYSASSASSFSSDHGRQTRRISPRHYAILDEKPERIPRVKSLHWSSNGESPCGC